MKTIRTRPLFFRRHLTLALIAAVTASRSSADDAAGGLADLAKAAQRYDVVGLKLGVPLKEAMQGLKAHNPKLQLKTETIKVSNIGEPLVYNVSATSPGEQFYFTLTLPPNPILVTRIQRQINFTKDSAPTQQGIVADLLKKYGDPTYDSGPAQLSAYFRLLTWYGEAGGMPIHGAQHDSELGFPSFYSGSNTVGVGPLPLAEVRNRIESARNFEGSPNTKRHCLQVHLQSGVALGLTSPDVVGTLTVSMGDGPLEQAAYKATSQMIANNAQAAQQKQTQSAEKNRPKF